MQRKHDMKTEKEKLRGTAQEWPQLLTATNRHQNLN